MSSVRLRLLPINGIARLEMDAKRARLEAQLFQKAFLLWRLDRLESLVKNGGCCTPNEGCLFNSTG